MNSGGHDGESFSGFVEYQFELLDHDSRCSFDTKDCQTAVQSNPLRLMGFGISASVMSVHYQ